MKYLLSLSLIIILFQGCSLKNEVNKPKNVEDIKKTKIEKRFDSIKIVEKSSIVNPLKIFLNKDNKIKYICTKDSLCDYYQEEKHDYTNIDDRNEDIIWINENSFSPDFSKNISNIQCGRGSLAGYFVIVSKELLRNHNKDNLKYCYNRFTKLDSMQLIEKVGIGFLTFGTSIITSGNMHTVKFDEEEFKNAIIGSNLDRYNKKLLFKTSLMNAKYGYDVVYINSDNVKESLTESYKRLSLSKHKKDGVLFIDEKNLKIIKLLDLKDYKETNTISNISNQINDLLNSIEFKDNLNLITYEDVLKHIPPKIEKPSLPKIPTLIKDEFETKKEFNERVYHSVKIREENIKQLQKEYNFKIIERNEYIKNLESSYKRYLKEQLNQTNKLQNDLKSNIGLLSQILFLVNTQGFHANNFRYNAEVQRLYFDIYSKNNLFKHKAFATIPAKYAKRIKLDSEYQIEPILDFNNRYVKLEGYYIYETISNNRYKVSYTNKNYIPISQKVTIKTNNEVIKNLVDSKSFSQYKQKKSSIVSKNYTEIWYIDVVNRMNSKVPKWFSNPNIDEQLIAYGQAETLEEAKAKALHDLSIIKNVKISAVIESTKKFGNSIERYESLTKTVKAKTNSTFKKNDYKVLKQEKVDGIWYVSLVLNSEN